jgi:hypothetical protein
MLQTEILRNGQATPPRVLPALWWRRHRAVLLPQITLVLGVLALVCGALVAVDQYAHKRAELRVAETNRFLDEFRSDHVGDAAARVGAAWQAEAARQDLLLARLASAAGNDLAGQRRNHQLFVLETIEEYGLQPDIEVVRQFVIRLATCVRAGLCDRDVAAAQLGPTLWAFRDQHWHYFRFEYSGVDLDRYLEAIVPRPASAVQAGTASE